MLETMRALMRFLRCTRASPAVELAILFPFLFGTLLLVFEQTYIALLETYLRQAMQEKIGRVLEINTASIKAECNISSSCNQKDALKDLFLNPTAGICNGDTDSLSRTMLGSPEVCTNKTEILLQNMSVDPVSGNNNSTTNYGDAAAWRNQDWSAAGQKACANGSQASTTKDGASVVLQTLAVGDVFALTLCYKHAIFTPRVMGGYFFETFHDANNKNTHWARAFYIRRISNDGR